MKPGRETDAWLEPSLASAVTVVTSKELVRTSLIGPRAETARLRLTISDAAVPMPRSRPVGLRGGLELRLKHCHVLPVLVGPGSGACRFELV